MSPVLANLRLAFYIIKAAVTAWPIDAIVVVICCVVIVALLVGA